MAVLWLAGALAVVGIGYFIPTRPEVSLALGVLVCLFGMTLMDSAIIPLLLVVPVLVSYRVALGDTDLTVSDAALFFAFFPAAIFAQRPYTPAMRSAPLVLRHLRGDDPVHGDRQPLPGQRDRVGARRAAHRPAPWSWAGASAAKATRGWG